MANVKGVILNGAKYELLDAEARQLAGDAINQVETLENTVAAVETDVAVVKTDLATVAETATEAKTTATEANTLATQAEARAQEAYELAEKAEIAVGIITGAKTINSEQSSNLSEAEVIQLFGDTLANLKSGTIYLLHFYIKGTAEIKPTESILVRAISGRLNPISRQSDIINFASSTGIVTLTNTSAESVSLFIEAIKQR